MERALRELGLAPDAGALDRLETHRALLLKWNAAAGLVSPSDVRLERLLRHYLDSIQALPHLPAVGRVVDVGSGGGFPGLVWSCFHPALDVILVEASQRKSAFLREAAHALQLTSVQVRRQRIAGPEELAALDADVATTRATAMTALLLEAGRMAGGRTIEVILYLGSRDAEKLLSTPPPGYDVHGRATLAGAPPGVLLVLRRQAGGPG